MLTAPINLMTDAPLSDISFFEGTNPSIRVLESNGLLLNHPLKWSTMLLSLLFLNCLRFVPFSMNLVKYLNLNLNYFVIVLVLRN